jgi:GcrA cell cycle regulator
VSAAGLKPMDAEIVRRRLAGETYAAIADAMDRSESWLHWRLRALRDRGCAAVAPVSTRGTGGGSKSWPAKRIARLRVLWDEGHSTAKIGRRLGVTKNAVVGQAHRLDLPGRPSPIRRSGEPKSEHRRPSRPPIPRATLPPLASEQKPGAGRLDTAGSPVAPRAPAPGSGHSATPATKGATQAVTGGVTTGRVVTPPAAPRPPSAAAAPHRVPVQHIREVAPPARGRVVECAWCLNDTGRPRDFRFCDAPSEPGRPFCAEHGVGAYQRAPDRHEDAPAARVPA